MVVDDGSGPPTCDRPGCDQPWPGESGQELPGAWRLAGYDDTGRLVVRLFCSRRCSEAEGR